MGTFPPEVPKEKLEEPPTNDSGDCNCPTLLLRALFLGEVVLKVLVREVAMVEAKFAVVYPREVKP